jgi:hypothetical protein
MPLLTDLTTLTTVYCNDGVLEVVGSNPAIPTESDTKKPQVEKPEAFLFP